MTTKRIVYTRPDGGVSVVVPAPNFVAEFPDETAAIASIRAKDVPVDATNVEVIEQAEIPTSRVFRNAWEKSGMGPPTVNMPKARIIKTDNIRVERDTRLEQADNDLKIAQDGNNGAEQARVRARREALRDLPITIQSDLDAITGPDELDAYEPIWPE